MATIGISRGLARHAVAPHSLDEQRSEWLRLLLADYYAVCAGGAALGSTTAAAAAIDVSAGFTVSTPAPLITGGFASPEHAALLNGISAHGLDLDDTFEAASLHPGVVVFPAVLAVAARPGTTTAEVLAAAAVGYDVTCELGLLLGAAESYARGFHPTGVAGVVGAAAALARLRKLDEDSATNAIGLAATMAAGSLEFLSDGSWTKRLNAGHAAATAVRATRLAEAGFRAPESAIEGRDGFLQQYGAGVVAGRELSLEFGRAAYDTSIKFYPCCRYLHGTIDLLRQIHSEFPQLRAADVTEIEVGVIRAGASLVSEPAARKLVINSPVDAQFSMPFAAALALATGSATVTQFADAPQVAAGLADWLPKVRCVTSPRLEAAFPQQWQAEVRVSLADGRVIERSADAFRGSPGDRASYTDIARKAADLLGPDRAEALIHAAVSPELGDAFCEWTGP